MCWILQDDSVVHQWKIRVTAKCRDKNFVFLCIFKLKLEIYNGNCAEENGTKTSITKTKMLHNYLGKKKQNSSHSDINDSIASIAVGIAGEPWFCKFFLSEIYRMAWFSLVGWLVH